MVSVCWHVALCSGVIAAARQLPTAAARGAALADLGQGADDPAGQTGDGCSGAVVFNHSKLDVILREFVRPSVVVQGVDSTLFDYGAVLASGGALASLDGYVAALAEPEVAGMLRCLPPAGKLAFWVNAYNALIIRFVLSHAQQHSGTLPDSIRDLAGEGPAPVWDHTAGVVAGESLSFEAVESRARALGDGRIHAAIVCASLSCPSLRAGAYDAAGVDEQLSEALEMWLQNPTKGVSRDSATGGLAISPIFDWHAEDFGNVSQFLASHGQAGTIAGYLPYNWHLNAPSAASSGVDPEPTVWLQAEAVEVPARSSDRVARHSRVIGRRRAGVRS